MTEVAVDAALIADLDLPGYEVVEHLFRKDTVDIFEVWSDERRCRCIAKALRPDHVDNTRARERLLREGRLLQSLDHPHLVRAYETIEAPRPVLILETLTGETLDHLIHRRPHRRLPAVELAFLGVHLSSAVHYLHRHGVLHRDLKTSNVVVQQGRAKVLDLSIAKPPGPERPGTGTRGYLAPEQARGDELTAATDVWGIGATLFAAATGRPPFEDEYPKHDPRYPQLERPAPSIRTRRRLPPVVADVIDACLRAEPARRPSVAEIHTVLDEFAMKQRVERPGPG
jgi:serine/threonine protein kinase